MQNLKANMTIRPYLLKTGHALPRPLRPSNPEGLALPLNNVSPHFTNSRFVDSPLKQMFTGLMHPWIKWVKLSSSGMEEIRVSNVISYLQPRSYSLLQQPPSQYRINFKIANTSFHILHSSQHMPIYHNFVGLHLQN